MGTTSTRISSQRNLRIASYVPGHAPVHMVKMTLRKCIYCLAEKDSNQFNKEHVLNNAFGKYDNTPTLNCVCIQCNDFFGCGIDRQLARGTFEGLLRYSEMIRKPPPRSVDDAKRFVDDVNRMIDGLRLAYPGSEGVLVALGMMPTGEIKVVPVPQVGFRMEGQKHWTSLPLLEVMDMNADELSPHDEVMYYVETKDQLDALKRKLCVGGRSLPPLQELPILPPTDSTLLDVEWTVNDEVRRGVAKIALNYAAFKEGADFVLDSRFDELRNYVRFGRPPSPPLVSTSVRPPDRSKTSNGHYIKLEMQKRDSCVAAHVSLFNTLTYRVVLVKNYGLYRPLAHGTYYDPQARSVTELTSIDRRLWLPPSITYTL
ncbi:MAG: HNH endonuclease [Armatimonadota bacterium]|nr:HNH endonuclease [Armatimonadota bacterium]